MRVTPLSALLLATVCVALCSCWPWSPSCEDLVKQLDQIRADLSSNEEKVVSKFEGSVTKCERTGKDASGAFMHVTDKKEVYQYPKVAVTIGEQGSKLVFYCFECKEKGQKKYLSILDRPAEAPAGRFWIELAIQEWQQKPGSTIVQRILPVALDSSCPCEDKDGKMRHFAPPIR